MWNILEASFTENHRDSSDAIYRMFHFISDTLENHNDLLEPVVDDRLKPLVFFIRFTEISYCFLQNDKLKNFSDGRLFGKSKRKDCRKLN